MWSRPDAESVCEGRVSEEECRRRKYYQDDLARASAAKATNGGSQLEARTFSDFLLLQSFSVIVTLFGKDKIVTVTEDFTV